MGESDFDGAIWTARRGLLASPGNAELTEALMRTYVASGDRAAAEDVFLHTPGRSTNSTKKNPSNDARALGRDPVIGLRAVGAASDMNIRGAPSVA